MKKTYHGSCHCGAVRFEVELPFRRANHCHCSFCRKHSGAFGLTQGRVPRKQFRLLEGEELLRVSAKLFREKGFDGTSIRDISAAARIRLAMKALNSDASATQRIVRWSSSTNTIMHV